MGRLLGRKWGDLFANPILGCYLLGYPKSDVVFDEKLINRANEMKKKLNLKYDYTVLYAPSWENDEKEDDFVRALASLNVNLLIKQASWNEAYQHVIDDIKKMRSMHEGKYDNVFYLEPEENILTALSICDLVVSDESSVMLEAYMFNKPSIAVIDWLIPDIEPKRFAYVPFDFVEKCKRVELRERVENHSKGKQLNSNFSEIKEKIYFNQGNCCNDILDAIEYYTANGENKNFKKWKLESKYMKYDMWD